MQTIQNFVIKMSLNGLKAIKSDCILHLLCAAEQSVMTQPCLTLPSPNTSLSVSHGPHPTSFCYFLSRQFPVTVEGLLPTEFILARVQTHGYPAQLVRCSRSLNKGVHLHKSLSMCESTKEERVCVCWDSLLQL